MKRLNVLMLGWDLLPVNPEEQEKSCFYMAQALAKQVNLSVLLPQTDPVFILPNGEIAGLDQLDLDAIQTNRPWPKELPYATQDYIRLDVPLYGSADLVNPPAEHAGQQHSAGSFAKESSWKVKPGENQETGEKQPNIFSYKDFAALGLDAQVIEYARYTCRWAAQREFDIIYAYNYQTFLAGMEMKLVSGKKLVLHVDSLSKERRHPNSKGWMFALEQQALGKSDYILTNTDSMAAILEKEYGILPDVIYSLEEINTAATSNKSLLAEELTAYFANKLLSGNAPEQEEGRQHSPGTNWQ